MKKLLYTSLTIIISLSLLTGCAKKIDPSVFIDENANNPDGVVTAAVQSEYTNILSDVIAYGADVNFASARGNFTALMWAAKLNKEKDVKLLIENGADINIVSSEGMSAVSYAASSGAAECISLLLAAGANPNEISEGDMTPLLNCTIMNDAKSVEALIKGGADINHQDSNGDTALMYAAWYNKNYDVSKLLIKYGADPTLKNSSSDSPLSLNQESDPEMTKILTNK